MPVPLKTTTIASLTRETLTIIPKNLLKKDSTYSSNIFKAHFMWIFSAARTSLVCFIASKNVGRYGWPTRKDLAQTPLSNSLHKQVWTKI